MRDGRAFFLFFFAACGGSSTPSDLVATATEPPGSNCVSGGVAIVTGLDANRDGILETDEVTSTSYVCASADSTLVRTDPEPIGLNCPNGGTAVHIGVDTNHDGILEDDEIQSTSYTCNTAPAHVIHGSFVVHNLNDAFQLVGVTEITGDLEIDAAGLTALDLLSLQHLGGSLVCTAFSGATLDLPVLLDAGAIAISATGVTTLAAPEITSVPGNVYSTAVANLDALATIGGDVWLTGGWFAPLLSTIGGAVRLEADGSFPALTSIIGVTYSSGTLQLPAIATMTADAELGAITAPLLTTVRNLELSSTFTLPLLANVSGKLTIDNPGAIAALPSLVSLTGLTMQLGNDTQVSLPNLTTVDTLYIYSSLHNTPPVSLPSLTTITTLLTLESGPSSWSLPVLAHAKHIVLVGSTWSEVIFPALVTSDYIDIHNDATTSVSLPALQNVGTLNVHMAPVATISAPVLTTATEIISESNAALTTVTLPSLTMASLIRIDDAPHYPACQVAVLAAQAHCTNYQAWFDDTTATCP